MSPFEFPPARMGRRPRRPRCDGLLRPVVEEAELGDVHQRADVLVLAVIERVELPITRSDGMP